MGFSPTPRACLPAHRLLGLRLDVHPPVSPAWARRAAPLCHPTPLAFTLGPCGRSELPVASIAPISKHFIIEPLTRALALETVLRILVTLGAIEGFWAGMDSSRAGGFGAAGAVRVTSPEAHLAHFSRKSLVSQKARCPCLPASESGPGAQADKGDREGGQLRVSAGALPVSWAA